MGKPHKNDASHAGGRLRARPPCERPATMRSACAGGCRAPGRETPRGCRAGAATRSGPVSPPAKAAPPGCSITSASPGRASPMAAIARARSLQRCGHPLRPAGVQKGPGIPPPCRLVEIRSEEPPAPVREQGIDADGMPAPQMRGDLPVAHRHEGPIGQVPQRTRDLLHRPGFHSLAQAGA